MFDKLRKGIEENVIANKKLQVILTIICLSLIIFFTVQARTGNISYLKDQTSDKWIPLDLDSYYFLRIAETMEINSGALPPVDTMRYYTLRLGWAPEFLPKAVYYIHKIWNVLKPGVTMAYVNIWYPLFFFIGSLMLFFLLVYFITESKLLGVLGVLLLSVIPPYVYHTILGSTDHESLGTFAFLLMMISFVSSIKFLEKEPAGNKKDIFKLAGYIILFAFTASFVIACWNGIAIFMFMIIPMSYLFIWTVKSQNIEDKRLSKTFWFYIISYPLIFIILPLWGNFNSIIELKRYAFEPQGLMAPFAYGLMIIDMILIMIIKKRLTLPAKWTKFRLIVSLILVILLGLLFMHFVLDKSIGDMGTKVMGRMLNPFGRTRIGLTVSENQQPFFATWLTSFSKIFFWIAFLGIIFVGINAAKGITKEDKKKEKEDRFYFIVLWIFLVSAILFTRYSSAGMFNGESTISVGTFFMAFALFFGFFIGLYTNSKYDIPNELLLFISWIIIILLAGRGAARLFIIISPLFVLMILYFIRELINYTKQAREELAIVLLWTAIIITIGALLFNSWAMYNGVIAQAKSIGPAASYQWQNSMSWVRTNTPTDAKFIHWWDYGYWVQYLGQRATLTDGGHGSGYYDWLTGRYILTGTRPDLALSFMKTNDVDYLLIDPTDIGKYTAFSSIGSNATGKDRISWIPMMVQNPQWIVESRNSTTFVFQGGTVLDEDIKYEENGSNYYLPAEKAGIGGVKIIINTENNSIQQPIGLFVYNNKQKELPIRYIYFDGRIIDFGGGIPAILRIVPSAIQDAKGALQMDKFGALIYISPKVAPTLFANIYLMNDPFKLYPTITIAHTEEEYAVNVIRNQGGQVESFFYFQGLRAPLQIYKVNYPENIIVRPDYLIPSPTLNEEIVLSNETLLKEIDNLIVTK